MIQDSRLKIQGGKGYTLIELLIYTAVFAIAVGVFSGILITFTRVQTQTSADSELTQQLSFVQSTIQRLVRDSANIQNPAGVASSSLVLRMASSTLDPTIISSDVNGIYLKQGTGPIIPLTNSQAKVFQFQVAKYENPDAHAIIQVDISLTYNSQSPYQQITRSLKVAIGRVSAATFDDSLMPNADNAFSIGIFPYRWKDAAFSGNLTVSGNVGIGTTETSVFTSVGGSAKLSVTGSSASTDVLGNTNAGIVISNTDDTANNTAGLHFAWQDTDGSPNFAGASIVSILGTKVAGQYPAGQLAFLTSSATNNAPSEKVRITNTGNVGIGTTNPTYQLQLSADSAAKPSTNTWTVASDERIKTDIRPFSDGLNTILGINPVWYKYNGKGGFIADGKDNIGVIAQDIQRVAPYTVSSYYDKLDPADAANTELLNFNSGALTFTTINAIKELNDKIEALKAENDALKKRIETLETK